MNALIIGPPAEGAVRPADKAVRGMPPRQGEEMSLISFTELLVGGAEREDTDECCTVADVPRQEEETERSDKAAGIGGGVEQIYWVAPQMSEAFRPAVRTESVQAATDTNREINVENADPTPFTAELKPEDAANTPQKDAFAERILDMGKPETFFPKEQGSAENGIPKEGIPKEGTDILQRIVHAMQPPESGGGDDAAEPDPDGERTGKVQETPSRAEKKDPVYAGLYPADTVPPANAEKLTPKGEAVERALASFLEDFKSAESGGEEIRLVLEPEDMGEMTISVSRSEKGVSATIRSADKEVCAAVGSQLQKLVESMESRGISVRGVEVLLDHGGAGSNFADRRDGGQGGQPAFLSYFPGREKGQGDSGFFRLWQTSPAGGGEETGGTVEYRV